MSDADTPEVVQPEVVNRGGRPTKIDQLMPGTDLTVADYIVSKTRELWLPWIDIAAMAGVSKSIVRDWQRAGVRARSKAALGHELTDKEETLAKFSVELEAAMTEGMAIRLGIIHDAATGGQTITRTTTKTNGAGEVVETVTVVETARPMWQAAAWQLERRLPDRFALGPTRVEISGAVRVEGEGPEERAAALARSLADFQAGIAAAAELDTERVESNGAAPPEDS